MPLVISNPSTVTRPGFYFLAQQPPASVIPLGTGVACIVDQFAWGPPQTLVSPSSIGDFVNKYAPAGMSRLTPGYLAAIQKGWPILKAVRVLGPTAAKAQVVVSSSAPTALFTVIGKYAGVGGNAITVTISAASNGNSNYFNLTASVTSASGTTQDFFPNLSASGGTILGLSQAQIDAALLVGAITWTANGNPAVGTTTMSGGTDGTIDATTYVGTLGTTDKGLALLEGDLTISYCLFGNPGSFRAACNAGMVQHCNFMASQFGFISGDSGQTATAAATDAASYQSDYVVYGWPWAREYDDTTGALQLVPPASFLASAAAQTAPSTRIAARDPSITQFYSGIQSLEAEAGANASTLTAAGVTTLIRNPKGGYCVELDVTTNLPQNPSQGDLPTQRMAVYIAAALQNSLSSWVNGPNVEESQQSLIHAVSNFMAGLKQNSKNDPLHNPYVKDWGFGDLNAYNSQATQDAGQFFIPLLIKTDAGMQKIFVAAQFGPTVNISVTSNAPQVGG